MNDMAKKQIYEVRALYIVYLFTIQAVFLIVVNRLLFPAYILFLSNSLNVIVFHVDLFWFVTSGKSAKFQIIFSWTEFRVQWDWAELSYDYTKYFTQPENLNLKSDICK